MKRMDPVAMMSIREMAVSATAATMFAAQSERCAAASAGAAWAGGGDVGQGVLMVTEGEVADPPLVGLWGSGAVRESEQLGLLVAPGVGTRGSGEAIEQSEGHTDTREGAPGEGQSKATEWGPLWGGTGYREKAPTDQTCALKLGRRIRCWCETASIGNQAPVVDG